MVALLLVVRLQMGAPLVLEAIVLVEFVVFLAVPTRAEAPRGKLGNGNATFVGTR